LRPFFIPPKWDLKAVVGCLSIFASAFFFYLATVIIKWSRQAGLMIDPAFFVFTRFLLGFLAVLGFMGLQKQWITVRKKRYLIGRTLANCVAVYCFFKGVSLTPVAQANILNMTYPLFITLFSWIFLKEQRDLAAIVIVLFAFAGIWLILSPGRMQFNVDSLWGLASGIAAAVAIIYLNLSRRVHDTHTTLFFLFGLGTLVVFVLFYRQMYIPDTQELSYLFWCSASAILGQYLLTQGFKYVTALEGGIISSTRILLAAILGPLIAMDPVLPLSGWLGAGLIFGANVYLTIRKAGQ
jgi:drug/metabolite transporter (DMT)-like permease